MGYFVYIIQSLKDKGYYIGYTNNLDRRLSFHNEGKTLSTKNRKPFKVVYFEKLDTISNAIRREKEIKSYKGGNAFRKLLNL